MALKADEAEAKLLLKKQQMKDNIAITLWAKRLPPINTDDVEQLKKRIELYFDTCAEKGYIPAMEGMCLALHITRQQFKKWIDGSARKGIDHQRVCMEAYQFLVAFMENSILDGTIPPVPAIFTMTNQFDGYVQKQVVTNEINTSILDSSTPEQLEHRYGSGSIVDVEYEEKPVKQKVITSKSSKAETNKSKKSKNKN